MSLSAARAFRSAMGWVPVLTVGSNSPPGSPAAGDRHVVGTSGSGGWAGLSKHIVRYSGSAWIDDGAPVLGQRVYATGGTVYCYDGSAWTAVFTAAPLASPAFTGTPTAPTAAPGTNTTQIATTAFVKAAIDLLIDSSPGTLDTLNELAAALGDDANFSTTITNLIATKAYGGPFQTLSVVDNAAEYGADDGVNALVVNDGSDGVNITWAVDELVNGMIGTLIITNGSSEVNGTPGFLLSSGGPVVLDDPDDTLAWNTAAGVVTVFAWAYDGSRLVIWREDALSRALNTLQPLSTVLTLLSGLSPAADKLPYFTGVGSASLADLSSAGRALIDDADASAQRTTLGLAIGTNVQAYDSNLASLSNIGIAAINDFRLTGVTATPVMTADSASLGTIYLTPYKGTRIALYNGSDWDLLTSAEVSLALSSRTADLPFDIFAYNNSGTVTLEFLDWTNATTRAAAIVRQDGVWCKSGALTRRYLGTCRPNAATTFPWVTEGDVNSSGGNTPVKLGLWNVDNRVRVACRLRDSGSSHSYSTATTRAWNNSANARFELIAGLAEEAFTAAVWFISNNTTTAARISGFGIDSTTAFSGVTAYTAGNDTYLGAGGVHYQVAVGNHYVAWLERPYSGTVTWYGIADGSTALQSGCEGQWFC